MAPSCLIGRQPSGDGRNDADHVEATMFIELPHSYLLSVSGNIRKHDPKAFQPASGRWLLSSGSSQS
jgi:hypothetical protein